jgi:hypothetical protein
MENSAIAITATLVESQLLTNLVEKLAVRRYNIGYRLEKVQPGWQAFEASSIEAHVSAVVNLSTKANNTNLAFTTGFLFTCIKVKRQGFNLTWANSLS